MPCSRQPPCLLNNIHKAITDRDLWISPESRRTKHMEAFSKRLFMLIQDTASSDFHLALQSLAESRSFVGELPTFISLRPLRFT